MPNTYIKRQITFLIDRELTQKRPKIILILGQRRAGKTWELKRLEKQREDVLYFDFEDISQRNILQPAVAKLEEVVGQKNGARRMALDEIQYLDQAGSILKLLYDHFPQTSVVATGSASFFMMRNIGDSLYGRHLAFDLFPLTFREVVGDAANRDCILGRYDNPLVKPQIEGMLPAACIYGTLPEVYLEDRQERKRAILKNYVTSLLFKDIFEIEGIRNPRVFQQLLQLLALQLGSEMNPNEIARQLGISRRTVLEYIGLYEKFHVLHTLRSFSTNPRKEISKGFKVYFSDLGIRNAVINNFTHVDSRTDRGGMFENLVVNLFRQNRSYLDLPWEMYFWRSAGKAEVDLVIHNTETGKLTPIEIKYSRDKQPTRSFTNMYSDRVAEGHCVTYKNLWRYI